MLYPTALALNYNSRKLLKGIEMSGKLVTNSMHWGWKVSFGLTIAWFINWTLRAMHDAGSERYPGLNTDIIQIGLIPLRSICDQLLCLAFGLK